MNYDLKPCPLCGDAMQWGIRGRFEHTLDAHPECPLYYVAFDGEYAPAWNRRAPSEGS